MILSVNQPYFAPFPGFFYKILRSDIFVILDQVQFPRGTTWLSRNRFKNDQGTWWMTVPVWKKGLGLQDIDDVRICREGRWARKHLAGLQHAYTNAPYFAEHGQFLENLFKSGFDRLIEFNLMIIRHLMLYLGVDTEIRRLSELKIQAAGERLPMEICRYFGASAYLAPAAAAKFIDAGAFDKAGIQLHTVKARHPVYPQLWGSFIYNLSILDLLFNCGPKALEIIKKYQGCSLSV